MRLVLARTAARGGGIAGARRGEGRVREGEERKTRERERDAFGAAHPEPTYFLFPFFLFSLVISVFLFVIYFILYVFHTLKHF
jgi:hypothetical protein